MAIIGSCTLSDSLLYIYKGHKGIYYQLGLLSAFSMLILLKIGHLKVVITPWNPLSSCTWGVWAMAAATGPLSGIFGCEPNPFVTFLLDVALGSAGDGRGGDSAG
jgi:hypothetical protein